MKKLMRWEKGLQKSRKNTWLTYLNWEISRMNMRTKNNNFWIQLDIKKNKSKSLMPFLLYWWTRISLIWLLTTLIGMKKKDNGQFLTLSIGKGLFLCRNYSQGRIFLKKKRKKKLFLEILKKISMIKGKNPLRWIKLSGMHDRVVITPTASTCLQNLTVHTIEPSLLP